MAYRAPTFFTSRIFNPIAMRTGLSGTEVLEIAGRRTGEARRIPVIPLAQGGERYLVSPRGETHWVRNLRAAGGACRLGPHDALVEMAADEVPVEARGPLLDAYREMAGRAVASHFRALPDASDHPTFRLMPRAGGGVV